jgi:predicted phosphodiesterase
VRIGIISDIHANLEALREALAALELMGIDTVMCLGEGCRQE